MAQICMPPLYDIFCMEPVSMLPAIEDSAKGCYINLQGHGVLADGIYIFNGVNWVVWINL